MNNIICIAGPTASGKTALSIALAQQINGEIISCDSMQIYRNMDIGTAKPTKEERAGIPHYMLDVANPREEFSVSRYCQLADPIVSDIIRRGKTAIIVGGTGLYMDALIRGNTFAPCPSTGKREQLEALAQEQGMEALWSYLQEIDPETAGKLHISDRKRIIRAIEVYQETGETISAHNAQTKQIPPKYSPFWIGLSDENRDDLYARINRRVLSMLDMGLIGEIEALLASGVPADCTAMQAIGYKEFLDFLQRRSTLEEATALVQQASRHYAKRQLTWFRRNRDIHWIYRNPETHTEEIVFRARQLMQETDN